MVLQVLADAPQVGDGTMPSFRRSLASPMPDSIRSLALWMVPAARMTSRVASTVCARSPVTISTPLARSPSKSTFVTLVFSSRVRFGTRFGAEKRAPN